jgi:hypothetical protein
MPQQQLKPQQQRLNKLLKQKQLLLMHPSK